MKHLFGPVPSRRLGMSLGIDLVPYKVCTFDCVYCECGKTTNLTIDRKEYVNYEEIKKELAHYFSNNPDPDYFTFSGSGEPTLNSCIGKVLNFLKERKPKIPAAVLTNGSLLYQKQLRKELLPADIVLPSLDAAHISSFQKINAPFHKLNVDTYIQGIKDFSREYSGKIWLEIFILPGYNDTEENLLQLKKAVQEITPDKIQLNTLDRPGRIAGLKSASKEQLLKIKDFFNMPNTEIVASAPSIDIDNKKTFRTDIQNTIIETISRRPCTIEDLSNILNLRHTEISKHLRLLDAENKIETIHLERGLFYKSK